MNKYLIRVMGAVMFLLILIFIIILVYDNYLHRQEDLNSPGLLGSYWDTGYYKIDPETILTSLEDGNTGVFTPLLENPDGIEEVANIPIRWTQTDFLKIASALGQFEWNDPMDLKDWSLYYISFEGSCGDPMGFSFASIAYFKAGTKRYTTRLIEIDPYFGWVRWGAERTYPKPILQKWNGVDLLRAKITADDALLIASKDAKERFQLTDNCGVLVSTPQNNDPANWYLRLFKDPDFITYTVNLDTGNFAFQKVKN
jgi:hypothetical protein